MGIVALLEGQTIQGGFNGMSCSQEVDSDNDAPRGCASAGMKGAAQRKAVAACKRTGRKTGEYAHITQDMLKDGGFFDMPIQVSSAVAG